MSLCSTCIKSCETRIKGDAQCLDYVPASERNPTGRKASPLSTQIDSDWPMSKDIPGYEGLYSVSRCGRIFSAGMKTNHTLPIELIRTQDQDGYFRVVLQNNKRKMTLRVARLVAITYLDNPLNLPVVNHIDENKQNDCVENLEWTDFYGNWKHSCGSKEQPVMQLTKDGDFVATYKSLMEASRCTGINQGNITNCLKGRCRSVGGFRWEARF